jgi:hypothetical protein
MSLTVVAGQAAWHRRRRDGSVMILDSWEGSAAPTGWVHDPLEWIGGAK